LIEVLERVEKRARGQFLGLADAVRAGEQVAIDAVGVGFVETGEGALFGKVEAVVTR
jgi:hypothetical protein